MNPDSLKLRRTSKLFDSARSLRGQLIRGGAGSVGIKTVSGFLALAVTILLARILGPEQLGIYAFALSIVTLLAIPAQMGLPTLAVREIARYQLGEQWSLLRGFVRRSNQAVIGISLLVIVGGWVGISIAGGEETGRSEYQTILVALVLVPFISLGNLRGGVLRGLRKVIQGQVPEMVVRPILFLTLIALTMTTFESLTAPVAMGLNAVSAAGAFLLGAWMLNRSLPQHVRRASPSYETAAWAVSVMPLSFIAGMQIINTHTDIVMLGLMTSDEDVGIYRVSAQCAALVAFMLSAVNVAIAPHISRLYVAGEMARLQRMITWSARVVLIVSVPVALVFVLVGDAVLAYVFGKQFARGADALAILCVGQLINAGMGSVGYLLNMTGHERYTAYGVGIAACLNVMLNAALIPAFGVVGAAIATATTYIVWNVILWQVVRVRLGIESTALGQTCREKANQ